MTSLAYQYDDLMNPVLRAIRDLGGSGTNEEINAKVAQIAQIPPDQLEILHDPVKGGLTELEYRLMWTRTYLKKYGLIDNSARGVWSLTPAGAEEAQRLLSAAASPAGSERISQAMQEEAGP